MAKECDSKTCDKTSCEGCSQQEKSTEHAGCYECNPPDVKHVIGIVSGKGGVGKSFVTASLANQNGKERLQGRNPGCRHHRSVHPENVRTEGCCPGKRQRHFPNGN